VATLDFDDIPTVTPTTVPTLTPSPTPTSTPRPSASSRAIYSARMDLPGGTESYWQLFLTDANGANPVNISSPNLSSPLYANDQQPQWSPDGLRILFTEQVSGSPRLAVMNADGSQRLVRLSRLLQPSSSASGARLPDICSNLFQKRRTIH
jgi:Tol biopolymer transport system component